MAKIAQRGAVPYVMTKGAIDAMTRAMAIDEAEHGVRVNGLVCYWGMLIEVFDVCSGNEFLGCFGILGL